MGLVSLSSTAYLRLGYTTISRMHMFAVPGQYFDSSNSLKVYGKDGVWAI